MDLALCPRCATCASAWPPCPSPAPTPRGGGVGYLLGVTDINGYVYGTTVPLITVLKYLSEMAHAGFLRWLFAGLLVCIACSWRLWFAVLLVRLEIGGYTATSPEGTNYDHALDSLVNHWRCPCSNRLDCSYRWAYLMHSIRVPKKRAKPRMLRRRRCPNQTRRQGRHQLQRQPLARPKNQKYYPEERNQK